jgi:ABC-2 type transport system permease protein
MTGLFLFQSALLDFLRPKRIIIWIVVAVIIALGSFTWVALGGQKDFASAYAQISVPMVYRLLPIIAAVFASAVITQEITQKTIVYLVTRPVSRSSLVVARALAASLVVTVVAAVISLAVSIAVYRSSGAVNEKWLHDVWVLGIGALAYVSFFTLISLWANKPMVICLLFAFGWETLVTAIPGDLYYVSIHSYVLALGAKPVVAGSNAMAAAAGQGGVNALTAKTALPVLAIIIAVCLVVAALWFSNFEYVPREDTE